MDHIVEAVRDVLTENLNLGQRGAALLPDSALLGSLPELDSMAVVSVITALEERFDMTFDDEDINARTFATLASLADLVRDRAPPDAR